MASSSGKLKEHQKLFLVRELACFATPSEAAKALKDEFGVEMIRQSVEHYDPTKQKSPGRHKLAKHLVAHFNTCREAFLKQTHTQIPEAHKAVRIKKLAHAARAMERKGNYMAMADLLERIAKECGNVHTNKREITGKDGGPIKHSDVGQMTDEQLQAELKALGYGSIALTPLDEKEES